MYHIPSLYFHKREKKHIITTFFPAYFSLTDGTRLLTTDQHNEICVYSSPNWHQERTIVHPHRFFQHITPIKVRFSYVLWISFIHPSMFRKIFLLPLSQENCTPILISTNVLYNKFIFLRHLGKPNGRHGHFCGNNQAFYLS